MDEDSADEVGELADTLLAEHGMGRQWVGNGQVMGSVTTNEPPRNH